MPIQKQVRAGLLQDRQTVRVGGERERGELRKEAKWGDWCFKII